VFLESGGAEFMQEAILMLKGVLGFTDQPLTTPPKLGRIRTIPRSYSRGVDAWPPPRNQYPSSPGPEEDKEVLLHEEPITVNPPSAHRTNTVDENSFSRSRATSDPFLDPRRGISPVKAQTGCDASIRPPRPYKSDPLQNASASIPPPVISETNDSIGSPDSPLLPYSPEPSSVRRILEAAADRINHHEAASALPDVMYDGARPLLVSHRTRSEGVTQSIDPLSHPVSRLPMASEDEDDDLSEDDIATEEAELNRPRFRLWTFPRHIMDDEAEGLMDLFPKFISAGQKGGLKDARFPFVRPGRGLKDLESDGDGWDSIALTGDHIARIPKVECEDGEGVIRSGTGRMWVGLDIRDDGWEGSAWFRFTRWWRHIFGRG